MRRLEQNQLNRAEECSLRQRSRRVSLENADKMALQMGKMRKQLNCKGVELELYAKKMVGLRKIIET